MKVLVNFKREGWNTMAKDQKKYDLILDALQQLLRSRSVQTIFRQ